MGNSWRAIDQGLQVAFGSGDREVLEHIAARIHDGDNDARQIFAKRKRGGHRDESDCIDPHAAGQEVADHGDEQADNNRRGSRGPNPICQLTTTDAPREQAKNQPAKGDDNQGPAKKRAR